MCFTIDTGCQRMAIGINTLNNLLKSQPSNLPVTLCNEIISSEVFTKCHAQQGLLAFHAVWGDGDVSFVQHFLKMTAVQMPHFYYHFHFYCIVKRFYNWMSHED